MGTCGVSHRSGHENQHEDRKQQSWGCHGIYNQTIFAGGKLLHSYRMGPPWPRKRVQVVNIIPVSLWLIILVTIVSGVYKPTFTSLGHHPVRYK